MKTLTKKQWEVIYLERKANIIGAFNPGKNIFGDIIPMLNEMRRYERQLHRLSELDCNGYPKQVTETRDGKMYRYNVEDTKLHAQCEKKEERIREKVEALAKQFNLVVEFQGDPRGNALALKTPDARMIEVG